MERDFRPPVECGTAWVSQKGALSGRFPSARRKAGQSERRGDITLATDSLQISVSAFAESIRLLAAHSRACHLSCSAKAKPGNKHANTPRDECLVVPSLAPELRPGFPPNTVANAATTRKGLNAL
jgi:hypothetical protein